MYSERLFGRREISETISSSCCFGETVRMISGVFDDFMDIRGKVYSRKVYGKRVSKQKEIFCKEFLFLSIFFTFFDRKKRK